eukprot:Anaeramoba_ignava/a614468_39.p1 GENE.a614468_39~~a614468_39.p1  ORF type:complete len:286 (-),score=87.85 a614468_39:3-860(-)
MIPFNSLNKFSNIQNSTFKHLQNHLSKTTIKTITFTIQNNTNKKINKKIEINEENSIIKKQVKILKRTFKISKKKFLDPNKCKDCPTKPCCESDNCCWNCKYRKDHNTLFCQKCYKLQEPFKQDHFEIFGLEKKIDIDLKQLEDKYEELQKMLHPDKFFSKSSQEQEYSAEHSSRINQAYYILKNFNLRARYLLHLNGFNFDEYTEKDPALLMEIMEKREEIENMTSQEELKKIKDENSLEIKKVEQNLIQNFNQKNFNQAKKNIIRLQYLTKLDKDISTKITLK